MLQTATVRCVPADLFGRPGLGVRSLGRYRRLGFVLPIFHAFPRYQYGIDTTYLFYLIVTIEICFSN